MLDRARVRAWLHPRGQSCACMRETATMNVTACKCARGCTNEGGRARVRAWLHPRGQSRACMREAAAMKVAACEVCGCTHEGSRACVCAWLQQEL